MKELRIRNRDDQLASERAEIPVALFAPFCNNETSRNDARFSLMNLASPPWSAAFFGRTACIPPKMQPFHTERGLPRWEFILAH